MYDPQTGDFINQTDYMYETYDGYEEDSANTHNSHNQQLMLNHQQNHGEDEMITYPRTKKPKVVKTDICIIGLLSNKDKEIISHSSFLFAISFFISLGFLFNFSFFFLHLFKHDRNSPFKTSSFRFNMHITLPFC